MGVTIKIAKDGIKTLEPQLDQAVQYRMLKKETDELVARREEQSRALQRLLAEASKPNATDELLERLEEEQGELSSQIECVKKKSITISYLRHVVENSV